MSLAGSLVPLYESLTIKTEVPVAIPTACYERQSSFIIPYLDWQARNRFWGHLSEMLVYRASEATTIRRHLPTYRYQSNRNECIGDLYEAA
jgi:hypothetical protein